MYNIGYASKKNGKFVEVGNVDVNDIPKCIGFLKQAVELGDYVSIANVDFSKFIEEHGKLVCDVIENRDKTLYFTGKYTVKTLTKTPMVRIPITNDQISIISAVHMQLNMDFYNRYIAVDGVHKSTVVSEIIYNTDIDAATSLDTIFTNWYLSKNIASKAKNRPFNWVILRE
jgi:hypothetical protein